jgi:hypothetical protein
MKSAADLFLQVPIEIDQHVAARDEIEVRKRRIFENVMKSVSAGAHWKRPNGSVAPE